MGLEGFDPIFTQMKAEWSVSVPPNATNPPLRPFLLYVHAFDPSHLTIHATDFHCNTWEAIRSVQQLDDMRDNIGIGGSWSDFVDYVRASITSEDLKLVLEGPSELDGAADAKLIAQKSKGMPRISISLAKLVDAAAATEAIANLSLELYKSFRSMNCLLLHEQEQRCQLTKLISAEQEKNESLQRQLDTILHSKRPKSSKTNDKPSDASAVNIPDKTADHGQGSNKAARRVVPAYRRAKVRGVLLQDTEDDG